MPFDVPNAAHQLRLSEAGDQLQRHTAHVPCQDLHLVRSDPDTLDTRAMTNDFTLGEFLRRVQTKAALAQERTPNDNAAVRTLQGQSQLRRALLPEGPIHGHLQCCRYVSVHGVRQSRALSIIYRLKQPIAHPVQQQLRWFWDHRHLSGTMPVAGIHGHRGVQGLHHRITVLLHHLLDQCVTICCRSLVCSGGHTTNPENLLREFPLAMRGG